MPFRRTSADWCHVGRTRRIDLGEAGGVAAWTDGRAWIGVDRSYLASSAARGWAGWRHLARVLLHEYAHPESDADAHMHDAEFLTRMHETLLSPSWDEDAIVRAGVGAYRAMRAKRGLAPDAALARTPDRARA